MPTERTDRCCNPYAKPGEKRHIGRNLRRVSDEFLSKFPQISSNPRICSTCRINQPTTERITHDQEVIIDNTSGIERIENINGSLQVHEEHNSSMESEFNEQRSHREIELEELFTELKEKFSSLKPNDLLRVSILTIAPLSWSINKIATEFNTSKRMARKGKSLKKSDGTFAQTTAKSGKKLSDSTVQKIDEFYNNDINSRSMAGKKETVSVKMDRERTLMQKRLLLLDLRGLYIKFVEENPDCDVGFSTFAKLRPKHCIFAGARGTHCMCVCTIHENCKLMLEPIRMEKLTRESEMPMKDNKDCLKQLMCQKPTPACYLDDCDRYPGTAPFSENLSNILDDASVFDVQFTSWTATDRSTLLTRTLPTPEFVEELCDKLKTLKPHSFIAKKQSEYMEQKKKNLTESEVLVSFDFSENYAFIVQNASQAFHFNNDQCTVFSIVFYYKEGTTLKHKSIVFLSDSLKHNTAAVYTIQSSLVPHLKNTIKNLKKIIYFSDGAKQHFKNRFQMINLVNHEEDFGVTAEWHFHATAHGKNACDGIGATFKREASRASLLAKPKDAILTPKSLYSWGKQYFKKTEILYFSKTDHDKCVRRLNNRFSSAPFVPQILINHSFSVLANKKLLIKKYSDAECGKIFEY